jgi:hypothetical protein
MTMKIRRSQWILLAWPASLLALLCLTWISGYVYWQIRISRAIAELKRGPAKYEQQLFYADPDLLDIGSRGLPRLIGEFEVALHRGEEDLAFAFACGIGDLISGADEVDGGAAKASGSYARTRPRLSMEEMKVQYQEYQEYWPEYREMLPPWWKWWKGHRSRRG